MVQTIDLAARVTRYEEALQTIARGDPSPTTLALLAYAALYNQPPVETAVEEQIRILREQLRIAYSVLSRIACCGCPACGPALPDLKGAQVLADDALIQMSVVE